MKKKGSLSLSINAVVVLVLAIALLGLGLAFTRGMFDKLRGNLIDAIQPPDYKATSEDPIVLSSNNVVIKKNQDANIPVGFYNNAGTYEGVWPQMECQGQTTSGTVVPLKLWSDLGPTTTNPAVVVAPQVVAVGTEKTFRYTVKYAGMKSKLGPGDFICNVRFVVCPDSVSECTPGSDANILVESKQISLQIQ